MDTMNNPGISRLGIVLLTLLAVFGLRALLLGAGLSPKPASALAPAQQSPFRIQGQYTGLVKLSDVVPGHYTDALATPTPAPTALASKLGLDIELQVYVDQARGTLSGYVVLERSLVFPQLTTIQATPVGPTPAPGTPAPGATPLLIGPRLTGTRDGADFVLESEAFTVLLAPERNIPAPIGGGPAPAQRAPEQRVTRQFRLEGRVRSDGALVGEYRETMQRAVDGLPAPPSTAIGQFQLNPPLYTAPPTPPPAPGTWRLYLPHLSHAPN
jgi:hypothetical protein